MKRFFLTALLLFASPCLAQCPEFLGYEPTSLNMDNILGPETLFGDPICLLRETQVFMGNDTGVGLFRTIDRFANVLFVVFTAIAAASLAARRNLELTLWFLAKLFLVGLLFGLHVEVRDLVKNTWYRTYEFSDDVWKRENGVADQLETTLTDAAIVFPTGFGLLGIVKAGGRKLLTKTAAEGIESQAGRKATRLLSWAPTLLNFMLYAFLPVIFIYGALIYLSGIQMLVFLLFWKLAVAFLMLPGGGLGMMRRLSAVYIVALIKVLWLPFMFAILIDLTLRQPMRRFNEHLQAGIDAINGAVADLNARVPSGIAESLSPGQWREWLESVPTAIMDSLGGVLTIVIGWVIGFVMMLVLLGVGIWLMQQTSGVVTSLVGGFGGGGAVPNVLSRVAQMIQQRIYVNRLADKRNESLPEAPRQLPPPGGQASTQRHVQPNPSQTTNKRMNP
jgi:hypothetical protein